VVSFLLPFITAKDEFYTGMACACLCCFSYTQSTEHADRFVDTPDLLLKVADCLSQSTEVGSLSRMLGNYWETCPAIPYELRNPLTAAAFNNQAHICLVAECVPLVVARSMIVLTDEVVLPDFT
jgi:hypothetical protein